MICFSCKETIIKDAKHLVCSECSNHYHLSCLNNMTNAEYDFLIGSTVNTWKCNFCAAKRVYRDDNTPITPMKEVLTPGSDKSESECGTKPKLVCLICNKGFSYNAHKALCKQCQSVAHFRCIDMSKEEYFKLKSWSCDRCSSTKVTKEQVQGKPDKGEVSMSDIIIEMRGFRKEVLDANKDLTDSMNKYSSWIEDNTKQIKEVANSIKTVVQEISVLKQENLNLKNENKLLTDRVNFLDQATRENVVEINGVPVVKDESIMELLKKMSDVINFDFKEEMVDNCYRYKVPNADPSRSTGIVVRFVRKLDKIRFVACRRDKRNLNSRDLGFYEGNASVIYVNDSLTQERRKLLRAAKEKKKEKQYTFLWVRNGRIFMRKSDGERYVTIDSHGDLDKLA
jgi:hypothetical protein